MKIRRILHLTGKGLRDCFTEKAALLVTVTPVILALVLMILYGNLETSLGGSMYQWLLLMCTLFALALLPSCVVPFLVGDEKEKGTAAVLL